MVDDVWCLGKGFGDVSQGIDWYQCDGLCGFIVQGFNDEIDCMLFLKWYGWIVYYWIVQFGFVMYVFCCDQFVFQWCIVIGEYFYIEVFGQFVDNVCVFLCQGQGYVVGNGGDF